MLGFDTAFDYDVVTAVNPHYEHSPSTQHGKGSRLNVWGYDDVI